MISIWGTIAGTLLLLASGHRIVSAAPAMQSDSRFVLIVGGELQTAAGDRPLVHAEVIHAEDRLVLAITASRSVGVFVAYCDSEARQQIYGPVTAGPEGTIDIPQGSSFVADNNPGHENLFVIASAEPLRNTDPKLDRILRAKNSEHMCGDSLAMTTEESRNQRANKKPEKSPSIPVAQRGRAKVAGTSSRSRPSNYPVAAGPSRVRGFEVRENTSSTHTGATYPTQSDEYGIAIVAFTFDHR